MIIELNDLSLPAAVLCRGCAKQNFFYSLLRIVRKFNRNVKTPIVLRPRMNHWKRGAFFTSESCVSRACLQEWRARTMEKACNRYVHIYLSRCFGRRSPSENKIGPRSALLHKLAFNFNIDVKIAISLYCRHRTDCCINARNSYSLLQDVTVTRRIYATSREMRSHATRHIAQCCAVSVLMDQNRDMWNLYQILI